MGETSTLSMNGIAASPQLTAREAFNKILIEAVPKCQILEPAQTRGFAMDDLKRQIKELMISALELEDIKPEDISDSEPIFGEGLGLDSIDALELGVALKKKFGVKFSAENADNKKHFASVDALAAYIGSEA
jgi:acyl carrier protein